MLALLHISFARGSEQDIHYQVIQNKIITGWIMISKESVVT
jgi:hypothetical protein